MRRSVQDSTPMLLTVVPATAAPQVGRVDGFPDAHAGDVAGLLLLAHVEAHHVVPVLVLSTLVVGVAIARLGAVLHEVLVRAAAPQHGLPLLVRLALAVQEGAGAVAPARHAVGALAVGAAGAFLGAGFRHVFEGSAAPGRGHANLVGLGAAGHPAVAEATCRAVEVVAAGAGHAALPLVTRVAERVGTVSVLRVGVLRWRRRARRARRRRGGRQGEAQRRGVAPRRRRGEAALSVGALRVGAAAAPPAAPRGAVVVGVGLVSAAEEGVGVVRGVDGTGGGPGRGGRDGDRARCGHGRGPGCRGRAHGAHGEAQQARGAGHVAAGTGDGVGILVALLLGVVPPAGERGARRREADKKRSEPRDSGGRGHGQSCVHGGRDRDRGCIHGGRGRGRGCVHGGRGRGRGHPRSAPQPTSFLSHR